MAYKTFLAFQTVGEPNKSLDSAIELAQTLNAHLDVIILGVLISAPIVATHHLAPAAEWVQHNRETMDAALAQAEQVEKYLSEQGISATVDAECDYPINLEKVAARYALCADVHVVKNSSMDTSDAIKRAFSGTLFDAQCPILLLPEEKTNFEDMSHVAIAWNGRAQAAHAVRCALPILKNAERVNIIVIDPVEGDVGQDPGSDLAAFLARYGINITVDVLASGGMTVPQKLMQRSKDINADLLIMGGYGHTKFREWLLGGTTHEMLNTADLPVFMAH